MRFRVNGREKPDPGIKVTRKVEVCEFTQFGPLESSYEQWAQMDGTEKSLNSPSPGPGFLSCTWDHMNWIVQL